MNNNNNLNENNLRIAKICSEDTSKMTINYLRIDNNRSTATDGVTLIDVTRPKLENEKKSYHREIFLSKDDSVELIGMQKKYDEMNIVREYNSTKFSLRNKEKTTSIVEITIADKGLEIIYPNTDSLFENTKKPIGSISVNAKKLKDICQQIEQFSGRPDNPITITIYGKEKPILFESENEETGQELKGLLMPIRI